MLLAHQERMGLPSLLDEHFPTHGHWQGLSLGWVTVGWLTHILSEADHRLNHVQPWAEKRRETLGRCMRQAVRALDFSDDNPLYIPTIGRVRESLGRRRFRRLIVRSLKQARRAEKALCDRLTKAQAALTALNKRGRGRKRFTEVEALRQAAEAVMAKYRVQGLLRLGYREIVHERPVRRYRDRPATVRIEREVQVTVEVDAAAVEEAVRRLGWRVYATNAPAEQLSLTQAVLAYRHEYIIERSFGRLKGKPLSLSPMYLQREDHATGLIRLLTIGLRVLTLLEFVVRRRLAQIFAYRHAKVETLFGKT